MSFEQNTVKLIEDHIIYSLSKATLSNSDVDILNQLTYLRDRFANPPQEYLPPLAGAGYSVGGALGVRRGAANCGSSTEARAIEEIPVIAQGLQTALVYVKDITQFSELYEFCKKFASEYEEQKEKEGYVPAHIDSSGYIQIDKPTNDVVEDANTEMLRRCTSSIPLVKNQVVSNPYEMVPASQAQKQHDAIINNQALGAVQTHTSISYTLEEQIANLVSSIRDVTTYIEDILPYTNLYAACYSFVQRYTRENDLAHAQDEPGDNPNVEYKEHGLI